MLHGKITDWVICRYSTRYHLLVLALVTSVTAPMSTPGAALTAETGLHSTRRLRRGWSHRALLLCHSVTLGTLPTTPTPHHHTTLSSLHPKHKCNALIYLPQSMRGVGDTFFTNQNKVNHRIWNFKYHLQTTPFIKKSKNSWYLGNINI